MKKIISIVLNTCENDSRVIKTASSLNNNLFDCEILAIGNNQIPAHDKKNSVNIFRIKLLFKNNQNKIFIKILFSILRYIELYFKILFRLIKQKNKISYIHCNDINTLPIGVILKLFTQSKVKIIYDSHEYQTEINGPKRIRILNRILEKNLIQYADRVITVSDSIANEYSRLYKIKKPDVVLNCPYINSSDSYNIFRDYFNLRDNQIIFLYQGGLSQGRGIEKILRVFKNLPSDEKIIVFMGNGSLSEEVIDASSKYKNIFYIKAVDSDILLNYTSSADIGLLLYENNSLNHYFCAPNKFFEYIHAELPVIISDLYEMKKIVSFYDCGIIIKYQDEFLKYAVERINMGKINKMKKNIEKMKLIYNWENQEKILLDIYKSF